MRLLALLFKPPVIAHAHCDLPCGVYDPAQARIEAESIKAIDEKYQQNTDPEFRTRCVIIKEQRSELVKHRLWVLWTDYLHPEQRALDRAGLRGEHAPVEPWREGPSRCRDHAEGEPGREDPPPEAEHLQLTGLCVFQYIP